MEEIKKQNNELTEENKLHIRDKIIEAEAKFSEIKGAMKGDCFPLKHTFADGSYIREITMPKGALLVTKIHKIEHPYFILKGKVSVLTEDGIQHIEAPYSGVTPAGTKRIVYMHEETVWTTVHVTKEKDLKKIEEEIIAKSFEDIDLKQIKNFIDTVAISTTVTTKGERS